MIVGTAGHVDHGKTALVKALTGIDTDRLPEEKKRGMTLELGFAHLTLADGRVVSLIDMPGHERFVKAMAAGAAGLDAVLLVIAADEGVMPQTREHLDICGLLGVTSGLVVVSKADLLPDLGAEWRAMLDADLEALVKGTFLQNAKRVEVSARSLHGIETLRETLSQVLTSSRPVDGPLFMPIDRAFTIKGFGCVVTGTVHSGQLSSNELVALTPSVHTLRLRGLQVHGTTVERVTAGQRAAVNLAGLETAEVQRGMALTRPGELAAASALDVELTVLPGSAHALPRRSRQLVALGTSQVEAVVQLLEVDSLAPGQTGFAQLRLSRAIAAAPGLRFILRGSRALSGRGTTLGGGRVLALNGKRRRKGVPSDLATFAHGDAETRIVWLLTAAGAQGLTEPALFSRASMSNKELVRVLELTASRGRVVLVDKESRRWLAQAVLETLKQRALGRLEVFHHELAQREGMPREELRQRLGLEQERTFAKVLSALTDAKRVELVGDAVRLPGRGRTLDAASEGLSAQVRAAYAAAGLAPPALELVASRLGIDVARLTALLRGLVAQNVLISAGALYFDAGAVSALEHRVRDAFERSANAPMTTAQFKELVGQSRKFAIPLAEYFDAKRVTLRVGDVRTLRTR